MLSSFTDALWSGERRVNMFCEVIEDPQGGLGRLALQVDRPWTEDPNDSSMFVGFLGLDATLLMRDANATFAHTSRNGYRLKQTTAGAREFNHRLRPGVLYALNPTGCSPVKNKRHLRDIRCRQLLHEMEVRDVSVMYGDIPLQGQLRQQWSKRDEALAWQDFFVVGAGQVVSGESHFTQLENTNIDCWSTDFSDASLLAIGRVIMNGDQPLFSSWESAQFRSGTWDPLAIQRVLESVAANGFSPSSACP